MVVYKGMENGTIKKRELKHHHPTCIYEIQNNMWMDERVMMRWVEDVLAPYIALAPPGIIPIILHLRSVYEEVSHWILEAYWALEGSPIIKNAWLKTGYSWFKINY